MFIDQPNQKTAHASLQLLAPFCGSAAPNATRLARQLAFRTFATVTARAKLMLIRSTLDSLLLFDLSFPQWHRPPVSLPDDIVMRFALRPGRTSSKMQLAAHYVLPS